jgi:SpoVK/Ycf46/Vps4 family AAA+-type ATPase
VAKATHQFSGADLNAVIDLAVEGKLREALKTGRPTPITTNDLLAAAKNRRPSTTEWFASARNHALYANDGGEYDAVLQYLGMKK